MPKAKVIREAIHGDIRLEPHELAVINTRVFQRLHGIKQLGMADIVYPTATHTRFEHVLGCVHVAQRIIDQLGGQVPGDLRDKIRMAALLHDLAHIPYGHTLEGELRLLIERHDSEPRLSRFFSRLKDQIPDGPERDRAIPLIDYAAKVIVTIGLIDTAIADGNSAKEIDAPLPREEWFVADIIGNTICADLLDYARRDMRATGLNQDYDDRLYSYFDLAPDVGGRLRLALRTTKEQGLRLDAVSEILHVLRIRYTLSERVLFHHTKNVASAMLGEALSYVDFRPDAFDDMRDEELLTWINACAQGLEQGVREAVGRLVSSLQSRHLHKTVFRVGPAQQVPYQLENSRHLGTDYSKVAKRQELQKEICVQLPQLQPGDIIVYCPDPQMTMKEVWVNVLVRKGDPVCRPLRDEANEKDPYLPQVVTDEVKALEQKYRALWSWAAMLAPDKLNYTFALQAFLRHTLKVSNDPFLESYWETHQDLAIGREIMNRAPGAYHTQAKAVEIFLTRPDELQERAATGPPDLLEDLHQHAVDMAREELYGLGRDVT